MRRINFVFLATAFSLFSLSAIAGNPSTPVSPANGAYDNPSHWQIGAGFGTNYAGLGVHLKKTLPMFGSEGRMGGFLSMGVNYGLAFAGGLDFYLVDQLYLSFGYGAVGGYSETTYDPVTFFPETNYYSTSGPFSTLNYDWFFSEYFGLGFGAGVGYSTDNVVNDPVYLQVNFGLKYAFEGFK